MNRIKLCIGFMMVLLLSACDNTTGINGGTAAVAPPLSITGGGVKGPLANATVKVYAFDSNQAGFKGAVIATATTNASAAITGLVLPFPISPPYIMEFTSTLGTTTDLTTGQFPVITTLRSVITQSLLDTRAQIYATPLTTMAVDIAVINSATGVQASQFEAALVVAAAQVVSTLGFGLDSTVDIFDVPPLVDNTTNTAAEQADVAAYRAAVEAVTAVAYQISQQASGTDSDTVLADLAADLADGGGINGSAGGAINTNTLQVLQQDPSTLAIPNSPTGKTVADVQAILVAEAAVTSPTTSVVALDVGGSITTVPAPAQTNPDTDGDGVLNIADAFPTDATLSSLTDADGDGWPAGQDPDDNDAANPGTTFIDTDGDGIGNTADTDDDNDSVLDTADTGVSPVDGATACSLLRDCDGDGVLDGADFDPLDAAVTFNFAPITAADTATAVEDAPTLTIDVIANDTDNDGNPNDTITLTAIGTTSLGTVVINANKVDYTPNANANGTDTFSYTVSDGTVTAIGTVTVTISAVNDAPVIAQTNPQAVTMDEDSSPTAFVAPTISAVDAENDALSWNGTAATNGTATVSGTGASPTISYTPNANFNGTDSFDATVSDGNGGSATITISVTVNPQNDTPIMGQTGPLAVTMSEDGTPTAFATPTVTATDIDGDPLTWTASAAANGTATVSGTGATPATFTYVPNANFNGTDTFNVTASDGNGGSVTIAVNITITPQNDAPVIAQASPQAVTMDEDSSPTAFVAPTISAVDAENDALSWNGTAATNGTATVSGTGASPTISYTPNANFNGTDSFDVTVSDGNGGNAIVTVNITINSINDAPIINGTPTTTATVGVNYTFTPSAVDVDTGDTLTFSIQGKPAWAVFNTATGALTGIPAANDAGTTFPNIIISVSDGVVATPIALGTFSIIVSTTAPAGAVWDNFNWGDGSTWQ